MSEPQRPPENQPAETFRAGEERPLESVAELHALTAYLEAVREEEQARIAREIHDELGQALTGLKLDVAWIKRRLGEEGAVPQPLQERLDGMSGLIEKTIDAVRRIATELRPSVLDSLGLVAALQWLADDYSRRGAGRCSLQTELEELPLEEHRATAVFRIAQEALTNVVRHAGASEVILRLSAEAGWLTLEVVDNGKGMPVAIPEGARKSLGLLGMKERALNLGGELTVGPADGGGTAVRARISLEPRTSPAERLSPEQGSP
jgi:two-component system sensor histidine kinase UhpB